MKRRLAYEENPSHQKSKKSAPVRCIWSEQEDAQLAALAERYHGRNWDAIAEAFSHGSMTPKTARQCRERWHNHLNPGIKDHPWTEEESDRLIELHQKYGNKWSLLAGMMAGRTDNSIKNFFFCKLRKTARCLKYGVVSLELDRGETKVEEAIYLLDYLYKYYISPDREKNLKKVITPQIKGRKNAGDKYVAELLEKEGINAEKFDKYIRELLGILNPAQLEFVQTHYPHFAGLYSGSETENTFSGNNLRSSLTSQSAQKPCFITIPTTSSECGFTFIKSSFSS